jgi:hypothetical protein
MHRASPLAETPVSEFITVACSLSLWTQQLLTLAHDPLFSRSAVGLNEVPSAAV